MPKSIVKSSTNYIVFLDISSAGLPIAISKIISEYSALGKNEAKVRGYKIGRNIIVTDIRPGLVDTAMAKGEGLFWVMPVEKVAGQIITAIRKRKSVAYVTKRWHVLAIINKFLPYCLYKRI